MIMRDEIEGRIPQRILAQEDHLLQARFLNSSDESFRVLRRALTQVFKRAGSGSNDSADAHGETASERINRQEQG